MTSLASTKTAPSAGPTASPLVPPIVTSEASRSLLANKLRASSPPGTTTTPSKPAPSLSQSQSQQQPSQQPQPQPPLPHYAPPTPIPSSSSTPFEVPRKRIISPKSLQRFQDSSAFSDIMGLTMALNESVKGKKLTDDVYESEVSTTDHLAWRITQPETKQYNSLSSSLLRRPKPSSRYFQRCLIWWTRLPQRTIRHLDSETRRSEICIVPSSPKVVRSMRRYLVSMNDRLEAIK